MRFDDETLEHVVRAVGIAALEDIHAQRTLILEILCEINVLRPRKQRERDDKQENGGLFHTWPIGLLRTVLFFRTALAKVDEMLVAVGTCKILAVFENALEDACACGDSLLGIPVVAGAELWVVQL